MADNIDLGLFDVFEKKKNNIDTDSEANEVVDMTDNPTLRSLEYLHSLRDIKKSEVTETKQDVEVRETTLLKVLDRLLNYNSNLRQLSTEELINAAKVLKSKISIVDRYKHKHIGILPNERVCQLLLEKPSDDEGTFVFSEVNDYHGIGRYIDLSHSRHGGYSPIAGQFGIKDIEIKDITVSDEKEEKSHTKTKTNTKEHENTKKHNKEKSVGLRQRIVFISIKVQRVYNIDTNRETFDCDMILSMTWLATKFDLQSFFNWYKQQISTHNDENKMDGSDTDENMWIPPWIPHLLFPNAVEKEYQKLGFEIALGDGILLRNDWIDDSDNILGFDPRKGYWVRGTIQAKLILSEELELEGFPFDYQDFRVFLQGNSAHKICDILPFPSSSSILVFNTRDSVFGEFNLYKTCIGFDLTDPEHSQKLLTYPLTTIYFKCSRKWKTYRIHWIIPLLMMILSLFTFVLAADDVATNSSWCITLLLADVATLQFIFDQLPTLPFDTIIDKHTIYCFYYIVSIAIWRITVGRLINIYQESENDNIVDILLYFDHGVAFIAFVTLIYINMRHWKTAKMIKNHEAQKLNLDNDGLLEWFEKNKYIATRQNLQVDFDKMEWNEKKTMMKATEKNVITSQRSNHFNQNDVYDIKMNEIKFTTFWMAGK